MIEIINGVYGHRVGRHVVPVRVGDDPIKLTAAQEARLVGLGVAAYVDAPEAPVSTDEPGETAAEDVEEAEARSIPEYSMNMTREQLNAIALELGVVDPDRAERKSELIDWMDEAVGSPPSFDASDAVVGA